jgi:hypothetical protein
MRTELLTLALALALPAVARAADYPRAGISNGLIQAGLYLPDPERGYYRGTRFDWSGVIYRLEYKGHNYFGPWLAKHDPKVHEAIAGPVEEFRTNNSALGYDEAGPGDPFVKIGVGVLRRGNEARYSFTIPFEIVATGRWNVERRSDRVEFTQTLKGPAGYAYVYSKRVMLVKGKPELVLEHALRNTGSRVIETTVYNHNFFVLDNLASGPDFTVGFPFELKAAGDLRGLAEVRGKQVVYLKELAEGQSAGAALTGFGAEAGDYDIRFENRRAGAGARITADRPIDSLYFWTARTTVCPELYIRLRIEPGRETSWRIRYEFYTLPAAGPD